MPFQLLTLLSMIPQIVDGLSKAVSFAETIAGEISPAVEGVSGLFQIAGKLFPGHSANILMVGDALTKGDETAKAAISLLQSVFYHSVEGEHPQSTLIKIGDIACKLFPEHAKTIKGIEDVLSNDPAFLSVISGITTPVVMPIQVIAPANPPQLQESMVG